MRLVSPSLSSSTGKTFRLRIDFRFDTSEDNRSPENELDLCSTDFRKQSTGDNAQIERGREKVNPRAMRVSLSVEQVAALLIGWQVVTLAV